MWFRYLYVGLYALRPKHWPLIQRGRIPIPLSFVTYSHQLETVFTSAAIGIAVGWWPLIKWAHYEKKWSVTGEYLLRNGFVKHEIEDFFSEDETFAVVPYKRDKHYWIKPPAAI